MNELLAVTWREGNLWTVKGSSIDDYVVITDDINGWSCSCPDWKFKLKDGVRVCKHITRVFVRSGEKPVLSGADALFMEYYLESVSPST